MALRQCEQLGQHISEKPGDGHTKAQPERRGVSAGPTAKVIPKASHSSAIDAPHAGKDLSAQEFTMELGPSKQFLLDEVEEKARRRKHKPSPASPTRV
jgi:hypothetical protein